LEIAVFYIIKRALCRSHWHLDVLVKSRFKNKNNSFAEMGKKKGCKRYKMKQAGPALTLFFRIPVFVTPFGYICDERKTKVIITK